MGSGGHLSMILIHLTSSTDRFQHESLTEGINLYSAKTKAAQIGNIISYLHEVMDSIRHCDYGTSPLSLTHS